MLKTHSILELNAITLPENKIVKYHMYNFNILMLLPPIIVFGGGYFGFPALLLMLAYGVIVMRGMAIAMRAPDYTGAFIAVGISSMIGIQAIINVAVNTNTIPTTGMQLPLVSYGGTALVVLLATLGILLNISRYASVEKLN